MRGSGTLKHSAPSAPALACPHGPHCEWLHGLHSQGGAAQDVRGPLPVVESGKYIYFSEIKNALLKNDSEISKGQGAEFKGDHADQIWDNGHQNQ